MKHLTTLPRSESQNPTKKITYPLLVKILKTLSLWTQNRHPHFTQTKPHSQINSTTSDTITENFPPVIQAPTIAPPPPTQNPYQSTISTRSLVQRLRRAEDKTLRHLAPVALSETVRPRIVTLDYVFQKGVEMHKYFIICYYNSKAPPFNQIQSVFNHMWGKENNLEIHNNLLNRSTIVRIPNAYLKEKILDKCIWYVCDSMFHTAQWSSEYSEATPPPRAIKIWSHLTGVLLDLRHEEGLSLVAWLVEEPKKTDYFTKNLVSLTLSHVKVEVDLTQPLPSVVEFKRESREVVEVQVHYPWTPPMCSRFHELGHIVRQCLHYVPPPASSSKNSTDHLHKIIEKPKKPKKPFQVPSAKPQTPLYRKKYTNPRGGARTL